jgi:hypothetical protein
VLPAASHPLLGPLSLGVWRNAGIDVGLLDNRSRSGSASSPWQPFTAHAWQAGRAGSTWVMPLTISSHRGGHLAAADAVGRTAHDPVPSQILYALADFVYALRRHRV